MPSSPPKARGGPPRVEIRPLQTADWEAAAGVAARALQSNPGFRWMLGDDTVARTRSLFEFLRPAPPAGSEVHGAWCGGLLVGCARMTRPPDCLGVQARSFGPPPAFEGEEPVGDARLLHGLAVFTDNEPPDHHWHLGPVAVEPGLQGHGIGHLVLLPLVERLDRDGIRGWLETDKPENARFYEAHGFETVRREIRFGVEFWLMQRVP